LTTRRRPDGTRVSDFEYDLPPGRIAKYPPEQRGDSRLLVVRAEGPFLHRPFRALTELFEPGDLLVVNESKVLPSRLLGRKPTGAPAEVFLMRPAPDAQDPRDWEALVRPGGKLKPGRRVVVADDLEVEILDSAPGGGRTVRLLTPLDPEAAIAKHGHVPLPPYIDRDDEPLDRERYQTVYARTAGSVAAPTAGLHFTQDLLDGLSDMGVVRCSVTLHVGIGTFRPVDSDDPAEHEMHHEWYEVPAETAEAVTEARASGRRVWAVGTTAVRTLEAAAATDGRLVPGPGTTNLFVRPPFRFRVVDALVTNFHLPRSTLLMLVAALGGYERVMSAYRAAIAGDYRFYSYGDAMAVIAPPDADRSPRIA